MPDDIDPELRERLRALAKWHDEWVADQIAAGVTGPTPPDRDGPSDYNQHFADMEASAAEQDRFHARANEIMGLPPRP